MRVVWAPSPEKVVDMWILEAWLDRVRRLARMAVLREPVWTVVSLRRATKCVLRARRRGYAIQEDIERLEGIADVMEKNYAPR